MVRARTGAKPVVGSKGIVKSRRSKDTTELLELINLRENSLNVPNTLLILEKATSSTFRGDIHSLNAEVSRLCKQVLAKNLHSFETGHLTRFVNHCSTLGIVDNHMIRKCVDRMQEVTTSSDISSDDYVKCALAIWAACIWNGISSSRVVEVMRSHVFDGLLEKPPSDWMILSRLSWCISSDASTRYDPSLTSRLDTIIHKRIEPLSITDLYNMLRSDSPEFIHVKRAIYGRLIAQLDRAGEEVLSAKNQDVAVRVLEAWAEMRLAPPSSDILKKVVKSCTRSGTASPDRVIHCLAVLDYAQLDPQWDARVIKKLVLKLPDWKPSLSQLATLCGAFPVFGLTDFESASFIAGHLDRVLKLGPQTFSPLEFKALWQVGLWYAHLQHNASETTLAAINDAFRPLMTKIASNMWEKQGMYVKREDTNSIDPTERAIRTVVSESLSSLGISSLRNIHIVNTPFVAPLYLQDRNMGLLFAREGDQLLSDGRPTGMTRVMRDVIESYSLATRIVNVPEYENAFNQLSKDDFMEKILRDIQ